MKLITVHLPEATVQALDDLVRQKKFPNRSEAIRFAIHDLLRDEFISGYKKSKKP